MAIVIPAYNEEGHIKTVIESVLEAYPDEHIIVVDDGSTDNTYTEASTLPVTTLRHVINLGKGAALRTGARYAQQQGDDYIIFMDGDGQHSLNTIPDLLQGLETHDLIIACREFNKDMPLMSKVGNTFFTAFSKILFNLDIPDTQSGFRALKTKVLDKVMWKTNHYAVETEMLVEAQLNNVAITTVNTETIYHDDVKGTDPIHGIKIALNMIYWRLTRW